MTPQYTFTIWQDAKGTDHAQCGDLVASSKHSAICALARQIAALDCVPDGPIHAISARTGKPVLTIRSLWKMAGLTLTETDRAGLRYVRFHSDPRFAGAA